MKSPLHRAFKINSKAFSSEKELQEYAQKLLDEEATYKIAIGEFILEWLDEKNYIIVHTSGSTGDPEKIKLLKENVYNSAEVTVEYFKLLENTKALLCLPAEYIAGKMMLVRAMIAGWNLYMVEPEKNPLENQTQEFDFAAMVPYQVFHSLAQLNQVKKLIIGGGAVPSKLEEQLQGLNTSIFLTYGMTETISHVAVRPINGKEKSFIFNAMANIEFSVTKEDCLQIYAPNISKEPVITRDVVELLSPKSFKFLGRLDNVINTGGVKVYPETIEEKLSHYISDAFFVTSEKDEALGERVILIVESDTADTSDFPKIFSVLSNYERPKKVYTIPEFSYTDTGKIRREDTLNRVLGN